MNPILVVAALLDLGASIWYWANNDWKQATIWLAYGVATGILSTMKG